MDQDNLASALRALASDEKARPETARLRDVFDDVEAALRSGVRREAVLSALHQQGFKMTLESFKSALQRIRKERAKAGTTLPPRAAPAASASATPTPKQTPASSSNTKPSPTPSAGDAPASFDWESKRDKKVEW